MSDRYVIPSLARAFQVLDMLVEEPKGLTLAEMGRRSDIPKSTLFRILVTLQKHHAIAWNEEERNFRLGSRLWELGINYLDQSDLYHASSRYMKALAEQSRETIFMGTMEEGEVIYLRRMESPKSITVVKKLRQRVPAHCTATGVAMLAFLPESEVQHIIDEHGLPAFNDATLTDRDALMRRLQEVRDTGVAIVDGEYNQELLCVSAPVFDHTNRPRASLTIALISSQLNDRNRINTVAEQVRQVAQEFSREMGYSRTTVPR
jgi:DNA-binding IclR family transcriptional regulator